MSPYGDEETAQVALINPGTAEIAYKFLTNAESRGLRLHVSPPRGSIAPEGNREVIFSLKDATEDDLAGLKVVVEAWRVDGMDDGTKMRIPCSRKCTPFRPMPTPVQNVGYSQNRQHYPPDCNEDQFHPSQPIVRPHDGSQPGRWHSQSQQPLHSGDNLLSKMAQYNARPPPPPPPLPQSPPQPPHQAQQPPLPYRGAPTAGRLFGNDVKNKPNMFMEAMPFAGGAVDGHPNPDPGWLGNVDVLPYVGSMMVWVGLGVVIGKTYLCSDMC